MHILRRAYLFTYIFILVPFYSEINAEEINFKVLKKELTVSEFSLENQNGDKYTLEDLKGSWSLLFTGFTSCPDVCPFTLTNLEAVRANLGLKMMPENLPKIIFLAVDPARDKAILKTYLAHFHGEFIGLTGDKTEIDKLTSSINAFYRIEKPRGNTAYYNVAHSSLIALINPDGTVIANMSPPLPSQATADLLFKIMKGLEVESFAKNDITVESAWSPIAAPISSMHVAYFTVINHSDRDVVISGFESPLYDSVSLHMTQIKNDMAEMKSMSRLVVPANSSLQLQPGGMHLMLSGPKKAMEIGKTIPLNILFESNAIYEFSVAVKPISFNG